MRTLYNTKEDQNLRRVLKDNGRTTWNKTGNIKKKKNMLGFFEDMGGQKNPELNILQTKLKILPQPGGKCSRIRPR